MKLLLLVAATVAVATSQENEKLFSQSTAAFTSKLFTEVTRANPSKSVVISAFSVEPLLAQLSLGAEGQSHDQILTALGIPNDNFTRSVFPDVTSKLRATKGVTLRLAASLYVPEGYELNSDFAKDSVDIFGSQIQNVDFTKSTDAAKTINSWVEKNTNDKIKDLIAADSLNDLTRLVMCNAIYFKGEWKQKFEPKLTQDRDFHVSNSKTVKIPTMFIESKFKYAESKTLNAKLLQLPYKGDEAYLLIVLPNEVEGLNDLQEKLKDPNVLTEEVKNMYLDTVRVQIPKWRIETTTDLKEIFLKIGIDKMFDQTNSGLVKLLKTNEKLYVSQAIQKAFIEVNEEGAEAAAANELQTNTRSLHVRLSKHDFTADRQFYFVLIASHQPLFTGFFRGDL